MRLSAGFIDQQYSWISADALGQVKRATAELIQRDKEILAEAFYKHMLGDVEAAPLLSVKVVQSRLKPGIVRWMEQLLCHQTDDDLKAVLEMQRHIGEVHARANIPVHLVARGMRFLKHEIGERLAQVIGNGDKAMVALMRANFLIDIAFEEMSAAFVVFHESGVRTDEAYRMFAAGQNLALEKEKQVAALLDWENRLIRSLIMDLSITDNLPLHGAPFGLWLYHKAPLIFDRTHELAAIKTFVRSVDNELFPEIGSHNAKTVDPLEARSLVRAILNDLQQIRYLLENMFAHLTDMEVGRDALTQLFNRRFMPTILKQEIDLNRRSAIPFCVGLLDIDHFKKINDTYGHDAGDRALQHVASVLMNQVRASDFVFRYGGEEFLIVLAEVDLDRAEAIGAKILQRIQTSCITIAEEQKTITVTASLGIAQHNGHPDFQHLVDRADQALYEAKNTGRNRVVLARS
jgi:diguanylate cyclase